MFDDLSTLLGERLQEIQNRRRTLFGALGVGLATSPLHAGAKKRKKKHKKKQVTSPSVQCSASETLCQQQCVNVRQDPANCGRCGAACAAGQRCCSGSCADLAGSEEHCGACGRACGNWQSCCDGVCTDRWTPGAGVGARVVSGLWVAPDGKTVMVTELWDGRVAVFRQGNHAWERQTTFGNSADPGEALTYPSALYASPDGATAWVADTLNHRIAVWVKDGGGWRAETAFGSPGDGPGNFTQPEDVVVSADGKTAWIADSINNRVAIWEQVQGVWTPRSTFGATGSGAAKLSGPVGLALAADELTLWVVEQGKHRISVWSRAGETWSPSGQFGSYGSHFDEFNYPAAIAVTADGGSAWIADSMNHRVILWQRHGDTWTPRGVVQQEDPLTLDAPVDLGLTADATALWIAYETGAYQWFGTGCTP